MTVVVVLLASVAAGLALPWTPASGDSVARRPEPLAADPGAGWLKVYRPLWALLAALGAWAFVSGPAGVPVAVVTGVVAWTTITRTEVPAERRRREQRERELPDVVGLLATTLRSGCSVSGAVEIVCAAHPGPAADLLSSVPTRLALGMDPSTAWSAVGSVPELAGLARTMVRAQASGSSVATAVARLAVELDERAAAAVEERARGVGVRAAVPLGLCFLPSFLLLGVVPVAASLLATLRW